MRELWPALLLAVACSPPAGARNPACPVAGPRPPGVVIAGSGVWTPIVERAGGPGTRGSEVRLAPSIGSSGAIAALRDGEIDVGLLSRPLRPDEDGAGLRLLVATPSPLVFAGAAGVIGDRALVLDAYRHGAPPSSGGPPRPLVREPGDSGWPIVCRADPELCAVMRSAATSGRAEVLWTDDEMAAALRELPGALGPVDWHAVPSLVRPPSGPMSWPRALFVAVRNDASTRVQRMAKRLVEWSGAAR